jgi:lipopolysaccharide transport protein LptA
VEAAQGRLRADRVRYDARAQVVVATGNVSLVVGDLEIRADSLRLEQGPRIVTAEGRVVVRQREASLTAPALRYSMPDATAEVTGGAVLTHADVTIKAPTMRFDLREEVTLAEEGVEVTQAGRVLTATSLRFHAKTGAVAAEGSVRLAQPGSTLTGRRLAGNFRDRRVEVWDDVTFARVAAPSPGRADGGTSASDDEITVRAGRVAFRWDTHEAEAEERVVIRQRQRVAWADRLTYSEPSNQLVLTGRVAMEQQDGDGPAGAARVTCTRLVMTLRERDVGLEGPLRVTQRDRWATGDRGTYTEATRRLVVSGNVVVQDADGRRLQADRVTMSLADETFEAEGNVQTQFLIRPSPTRRP